MRWQHSPPCYEYSHQTERCLPFKSVTTFPINVCIFKTNVSSERKKGIYQFFILRVLKLLNWNKDNYGGEILLACLIHQYILTESTGIFQTCFYFTYKLCIVHFLFDKITILPVLLLGKYVQVLIAYRTIDSNGRGGRGSRNMSYFDTTVFCTCNWYLADSGGCGSFVWDAITYM